MKVVSVIVPVYNASNYIDKCYQSLIKQTYKKLEIIFVNDGSKDNSLEIINKFKDKRVKIVDRKNGGPSAARRSGFKEATGDYVCFIDSDDRVDKDYIENLVYSLEENDANMCLGRIGVHLDNKLIRNITFKGMKKPKLIEIDKNPEYISVLAPGIVNKLFKRELLSLKEVSYLANEDLVIMCPLYVKLNKIAVSNLAIYHNYQSRNSQYKTYLLGYKFDVIMNTFGPLKDIYMEYDKMGVLNKYYSEIEMLFIKNICERVYNISNGVKNKEYRKKFILALFKYLDYFFPNWENNKYYLDNFKIGEITDRYYIKFVRKLNYNRRKSKMSLGEVYDNYKKIEVEYEKNNK